MDFAVEVKDTAAMTTHLEHALLDHSNPLKLPILTEGILTPQVALCFELSCFDYFSIKDTATEKQVLLAMASICDGHMRNWLNSDQECLKTLSFTEFMNEICDHYLDTNWEDKIHWEILYCQLKPPYHFWNWAMEITNKNHLLTAGKWFNDLSLIDILESCLPINIEAHLRISHRSGVEISKKSMLAWMNDVKDIVSMYQNDVKCAREVADEATTWSMKHPRPFATTTNTIKSSLAALSQHADCVPVLTPTKHTLLANNEGCSKCHRFFVKHQSASCLNGYPAVKDYHYHTLTPDMATHTKRNHTGATATVLQSASLSKVMAITSAPPTPECDAITTVLDDNGSDVIDWASSSDEDDNINMSGYCMSHLCLKCIVHGSNHCSIVVNTFLNNGAYLVLIHLVIDHDHHTCIVRGTNIDLLNPITNALPNKILPVCATLPSIKLAKASIIAELSWACHSRRSLSHETVANPMVTHCSINAVIAKLTLDDKLLKYEQDLSLEFKHIFEPIPHVDKLPTDVVARIKLIDSSKTITMWSYASPKKYQEAWAILIQRHLDAGRIRPSASSPFASPAFLTPKTDPTVLPCWVNDYCQLNSNTVVNSHPLPHVDNILSNCAKGKIWGVMDMTDSFFQTCLHPDDMPLTTGTTPLSLYEWTVMPMGACNSPSVQQCQVTMALRPLISHICHVYIDDMVIWSNTIEEHIKNICTVLRALAAASLYCNPKKTHLFCWEIYFLGHHISTHGIEAHDKKVSHILDWPILKSASNVWAFLGLMCYIANFLPKLTDHTAILTPLTEKHCDQKFPAWTDAHQVAFDHIK